MTENTERAHVSVDRIHAYDQHQIVPPRAGVTVIVGANNSGKSTFLREISQYISALNTANLPLRHLIDHCILSRQGTGENLVNVLREEAAYIYRPPTVGFMLAGNIVPPEQAIEIWERPSRSGTQSDTLWLLADFFLYYVTTANRAGGIAAQQRRPDIADTPQSSMHKLEDNPDMLNRIQEISLRIFRQTLTLDRLSNNVQLRVGEPGIPAPPIDAVTREYRDALTALEPLQNQGDGMTAVLGLLAPIICGLFCRSREGVFALIPGVSV